jgi:hypothetical protein
VISLGDELPTTSAVNLPTQKLPNRRRERRAD